MKRPLFNFESGPNRFCLGLETKIMGVLNVTPDSFSDGGLFLEPDRALRRALKLEQEGAHFIDVGGESTRPGSRPVSVKEEIRRVRPVLKRLSGKIKIPLSIDTTKYEVALAALDEGVAMVNDISALRSNKRLARCVARYKAGIVLMHMQGAPRTMQKNPRYRNPLKEVLDFLKNAIDRALEAGIPKSRIMVDPGFGFGKTTEQNLKILSHLDFFQRLRCPILVGLSRKSFIGNILGTQVHDRLYGSLGAAAAAIQKGAHMIRVHDVLAHRQFVTLIDRTLTHAAA